MNEGKVINLFYTASEAADYLGCTIEDVRFYCRTNSISNKKIKGRYYIEKKDLVRMYHEQYSPEANMLAEKRALEILENFWNPKRR